MSMNGGVKMFRIIYKFLSLSNDVKAVKKGRVGQRIEL